MSGYPKWHENDHLTLPPHLIAPLPGRLGQVPCVVYPFHEPTLDAPFPCMAVFGANPPRLTLSSTPRKDKWCPSCQTRQPFANFGPIRGSRDGLDGYCRPCRRAAQERSYHARSGMR